MSPTDPPVDLRDARQRAGISATDAVRHVNAIAGTRYPRTAVHQWESGTRRPSPTIIVALAELYGLDPIATLHAHGAVHPAITTALRDPAIHRAILKAIARIRPDP